MSKYIKKYREFLLRHRYFTYIYIATICGLLMYFGYILFNKEVAIDRKTLLFLYLWISYPVAFILYEQSKKWYKKHNKKS